ncbi:hypothetical protein AX018_10681 [Paracidovorax anthurii]|uniref:Uncharacterized protein n=1 Tax=Paracidovorax anthurii TaxID=78229 RepID=A0A328YVC1_9BURK|nr:hypothetical protein AX018_10681 [Paracidovorax anthurii]
MRLRGFAQLTFTLPSTKLLSVENINHISSRQEQDFFKSIHLKLRIAYFHTIWLSRKFRVHRLGLYTNDFPDPREFIRNFLPIQLQMPILA